MPPERQPQPVTPKGRRTREGLLDAGERVAAREGMANLNVAAVVAEARVAKGTFYVYFASRDDFLDALHARFYAKVGEAVGAAVEGLPPGTKRLLAGIDAYLDVCLDNLAAKSLVREARAMGGMTGPMSEREEGFFALTRPSLEAIGLKPTATASRLIVAITAETALIEAEAGRRVPAARRLARAFVENAGD